MLALFALAACSPPAPEEPSVVDLPDATASAGVRAAPPPPRTSREPDTPAPIGWRDDGAAALEQARRQNKPVLVFVRADWSAASLEMERRVLNDAAVVRAARPFVPVRVDATDAEGTAAYAWLESLGVTAVPALVVTDASLTRRDRIDGLADVGLVVERLHAFVR